jgi:hypothetical protein
MAKQSTLKAAGFRGPFFVSIGKDVEGLKAFLEKNPKIPRENMFLDQDTFDGYKKMGLGMMAFSDAGKVQAAAKNIKKPDVNLFDYLAVASKVTPIPKNLKFGQVPEGVTYLGGTFISKGEEFIYVYEDGLPGDHPEPSVVIKTIGI